MSANNLSGTVCRQAPHFFGTNIINSFQEKINRFRFQHPGLESTIILLATIASKKNVHIILADDDIDDRELFEEAIANNSQIKFEAAEDGIALMKMLNAAEILPDLIFLDLNMPGKNGKKCLEEIRSNKKFEHIPVVIYSTSSSPKDVDETFNMGANLYIKKPNTFSELTTLIKKVFALNWNDYQPKTHKKKFVLNARIF